MWTVCAAAGKCTSTRPCDRSHENRRTVLRPRALILVGCKRILAARLHCLTFICATALFGCGDNLSFISWGDIGSDSLVFLLQDNGTSSGPWLGGDRVEFEQDGRAKSLLTVPVADLTQLNAAIDSSEEALLDINIEPAQQPECEAGAVAEEFNFFEAVPPPSSEIYDLSLATESLVASTGRLPSNRKGRNSGAGHGAESTNLARSLRPARVVAGSAVEATSDSVANERS